MGACSSKPKTTDFEGSREPLKNTEDVSVDRDIDTVGTAHASERSLQNLMGESIMEKIHAKPEDVVNASVEAIEEKCELNAGEEEPVKVGLSSSAEGDGFVQKDFVGDKEEAKDKASSVGEGVSGGAMDGDNICKDKVIVLNEVGDDAIDKGDVYMDKAISLDEEKAHESLDKGCVTTHDNKSGNAQDFTEPPHAESPIIGVVQSVQPIHVDDDVGVAIAEATVSDGSTTSLVAEKANYHPVEIERDVSTSAGIREDDFVAAKEKANLSPDLPQDMESALETSVSTIDAAQPMENEVLQENPKVSPLLVNVSDESGTNVASSVDLLPNTAEAENETSVEGTVEDTTKSDRATDPRKEVEESTSEPQGETAVDAESMEESHVEVTQNEGNVRTLHELEAGAPELLESIDAEISIKHEVETTPEEVVEEKGEVIVDEATVLPQGLAFEESVEDSKPEATSDETIAEPIAETERKGKVEGSQVVEGTPAEVESVVTESLVSSAENTKSAPGEGELACEDASDVPLTVDASNAESGKALNS